LGRRVRLAPRHRENNEQQHPANEGEITVFHWRFLDAATLWPAEPLQPPRLDESRHIQMLNPPATINPTTLTHIGME